MSDQREREPLKEQRRELLTLRLTELWGLWKKRGRPHQTFWLWLVCHSKIQFRNVHRNADRHFDEIERGLPQALRDDWRGVNPKEGSWERRRRKRREAIARMMIEPWEQWKAAGKPGGQLWLWVYEHRRDVHRAVEHNHDAIEAFPPALRDDWDKPLVLKHRAIGERTLARFMPQLAARFLEQKQLYGTYGFDAWCATVLRRYPNVDRLREFLTSALPKT